MAERPQTPSSSLKARSEALSHLSRSDSSHLSRSDPSHLSRSDQPQMSRSDMGGQKSRGGTQSQAKQQRMPIIRVLPMLVVVAFLMLSVRIHDVVLGVADDWPVLNVGASTEAQQPPRAAAAEPSADKAPEPAPVKEGGDMGAASPQGGVGAMTAAELDVLQKLGERRKQIDAREKEIERREDLLKAASDQIDRKVSELKTLQNTIQSLLQQYNDQEDSKMKSLVKIYENMKPKEAAKIFEQLDMQILLDVVERMKEQKVAPILAEMDPSKAKTLTAEMAQRRQMPLPKSASGG